MISYEEFGPWVATLKTPAQLRELSAIGADGMSDCIRAAGEGMSVEASVKFVKRLLK